MMTFGFLLLLAGQCFGSPSSVSAATDHVSAKLQAKARRKEALGHCRRGDLPAAFVSFSASLAANPGHVSTWNNLGVARWRHAEGNDNDAGEFELALAAFGSALALDPNHSSTLKNQKLLT